MGRRDRSGPIREGFGALRGRAEAYDRYMNTHTKLIGAVVAAGLLLAGCGGSSNDGAPTPQELASVLLATSEIEGTWTVNPGPNNGEIPLDGAITTDEQQAMLPKAGLCEKANAQSRVAADDLRWKAFRQLDRKVADPLDPPTDRTGHMIFAQEFLTSGDAADIEDTFNLLRTGLTECFGAMPADDEGPGTVASMAVPAVGDDRFGVLTTVEEAGGGATWRLYTTYVRSGSTMLGLTLVDIAAGVKPEYTNTEVGEVTTTAVAKLDRLK